MNILRKLITLFLILVIAFPGETAHAFSFVPEFIEHYNHHNEEHHQLSFQDFVIEHINGVHDETDTQHEEDHCPLSHDHLPSSLSLFISKTVIPIELEKNNIAADERLSSFPAYQFCTSEFNSAIWQPPKIA
ncbi:MAG: hypothetical protein V4638_04690 [Bacteroidota bacterium]